jgi:hypothetical protein
MNSTSSVATVFPEDSVLWATGIFLTRGLTPSSPSIQTPRALRDCEEVRVVLTSFCCKIRDILRAGEWNLGLLENCFVGWGECLAFSTHISSLSVLEWCVSFLCVRWTHLTQTKPPLSVVVERSTTVRLGQHLGGQWKKSPTQQRFRCLGYRQFRLLRRYSNLLAPYRPCVSER